MLRSIYSTTNMLPKAELPFINYGSLIFFAHYYCSLILKDNDQVTVAPCYCPLICFTSGD